MEFVLEYELNASPEKLYESWLSSEGHSKMTGGKCVIKAIENTSFTAWDGYISGKNIKLIPGQSILQSWRTTEFPPIQKDSVVEINFVKLNDHKTKIILKHSELGENDQAYKQGWIDYYFNPMSEYFDEI